MAELMAPGTRLGRVHGRAKETDIWPLYTENGVVEVLQVAVILVVLLNCLRLARIRRSVLRWAFGTGAVICLGCILREVEFDRDGAMRATDEFLRGPARTAAFVIGVPIVTLYVHFSIRQPWPVPRVLFGTWWGRSCLVGISVVCLGVLFDQGYIEETVPFRWEELLELNGYLLIALSSFVPRSTVEQVAERPLWQRRAREVVPSEDVSVKDEI